MSEFVETYRGTQISRDPIHTATGGIPDAKYKYYGTSTKPGGNRSSLKADSLDEMKLKIDSFLDSVD